METDGGFKYATIGFLCLEAVYFFTGIVFVYSNYSQQNGSITFFSCLKWAKCGYPNSQDGLQNITQYLTFLLDFALDADTFMWLEVLVFWESEKAENP